MVSKNLKKWLMCLPILSVQTQVALLVSLESFADVFKM
jgi:hypothetical protein